MNDWYKIPKGLPCAIQFSGGRTSGYMLHEILKANNGLPDDTFVLFQNTGREMPETLDFVQACGENFGVKITWLEFREESPRFDIVGHNSASRNGEPFEALIRKRKYVPNVVTRYCSDVLKYRTAKRYLVSLGYKKWTSTIGFRADEMTRVVKIHSRKKSREVIWTPLASAGVSKLDVKAFWDAQPFDLKLQNIKGNTPLGNCDGCFLKSENNLANLAEHYPERAAWWEKMEDETGASFVKDRYWKSLIKTVENSPKLALEGGEFYCNSTFGTCEDY
jgi:3'-phosphoadenosine 5'-phosphosulfate sulfotransferase (PAPS reductase)/FAD synthetase